jgi:methylthioribose-1-phosphate isomerase
MTLTHVSNPASTGSSGPSQVSLRWDDGVLAVVDQRSLPDEYRQLRLDTVDAVIDAIRGLSIRGAPAIGLAGAFAVAISARQHRLADGATDTESVRADCERIAGVRPTAVNLARAVRRAADRLSEGPSAVLAEAEAMLAEDTAVNSRLARRAADVVAQHTPARRLRILTHCNTGRFATASVGTALGAILDLAERGRVAEVFVTETRPLLQGARLTAGELRDAAVPYRLCVDSAVTTLISRGLIDAVLVGADRVAANGDTANKIGTHGIALAAACYDVPFFVVAPEASWDRDLPDGSGIEIEERDSAEVTGFGGVRTAPAGASAFNPAFDVTPARLITAVVSEDTVIRPESGRARPDAADEIVALTRSLYQQGWMPGTSGNVSVRHPTRPGQVLITASGRSKGELTTRDVVCLDLESGGAAWPGQPPASAETAIHLAVYRNSGAGAVIHAHSPYATAATPADQSRRSIRLAGFELLKGLRMHTADPLEFPVFPNWPDVSRIAEEVDEHLERVAAAPPGLLIANHGITVWGRDLTEARNRLECLETIFRLLILRAGENA